MEFHSYEPSKGHRLKHNPLNAIVAPRPIGWISTCSNEGLLNLAPYSFFNAFNYDPPIIGFSSTAWKDSVKNASETREFVWNLVSYELRDRMNTTAAAVAEDVNEFDLAGLTQLPSALVRAPRVGEARVTMECRVIDIIRYKSIDGVELEGRLVLGQVVAVHIDKTLLQNGVFQTALAQPIMRCGGVGDYARISADSMFNMPRPSSATSADSHGN